MLTPEQRELRKFSVGGSEIAAILGVDPHKSAADIWLDKRGMLTEWEGNETTERGLDLEPVLISRAEKNIGRPLQRDVMVRHPSGDLHCNFDAIDFGDAPTDSAEAKSTVIFEDWGDTDDENPTDEVPFRVVAQAHAGFACVPTLQRCWVPVLMPDWRRLDFRFFCVLRNERIVNHVVKAASNFMQEFVRPGVRPSDFKPSLEVAQRIRREAETVVQVPDEVAAELLLARETALAAAKRLKSAKAAMLGHMGSADAADTSFGQFTYFEVSRAGYVVNPCVYRKIGYPKVQKSVEKTKTTSVERMAV